MPRAPQEETSTEHLVCLERATTSTSSHRASVISMGGGGGGRWTDRTQRQPHC